jgi:hypothetical protein
MARAMQALLLPAGQSHAGLAQLVLDLVPQRRLAQGALDALIELGARELLVKAQAEGDVVVDRHREGRRLLEHHADARAQLVHVDRVRQDVVPVEDDLALGALLGIEAVDAVEAAQQRGLAAARGADQRRHLPVEEIEVDVLERLELAVEEVEVPAGDPDARRQIGFRGARLRHGGEARHRIPFLTSRRATTDSARMATVIRSAPAQASCCQFG